MKRLDVNIKILVATMLLLALSYGLMAQPRQGRMDPPGQKDRSAHFIPGLTEEQKAGIKEIHLKKMKEVQPLKDEMKINRAKLNALVKNDNSDMNEIKGLVEANAGIQVKLQILTIESQIKTRSLLTDEQKVLFDARGEKMQKARAAREYMHLRSAQRRHRMNQQINRI